jgi:WD40 repeat protein
VATGRELLAIEAHKGWVLALGFSADGNSLTSAGNDGSVWVWNVADGQAIATYQRRTTSFLVAYSPTGLFRARGDLDGTVELRRIETDVVSHRLAGHERGVASLTFSADGESLASGGYDGTVRLWCVATGRELATLRGHAGWVFAVAFSTDSRLLSSGGEDNIIRLWHISTGRELTTLSGHTDYVHALSFAPGNTTLASGSRDKTIRLWRIDQALTSLPDR